MRDTTTPHMITKRDNKGRIAAGNSLKHGLSNDPIYDCWVAMKARCSNPQHPNYHQYGGRGITVCARWQESFQNFLDDMGPKPSHKHTLDRKDVNGNYEPGNCRWITVHQQQRNRRNNTAYPGCSYEADRGAWNVRIRVNGKRYNLGRFKDAETAMAARVAAEVRYGVH